MVGLTPEELESCKQLINIDHVYFKQAPVSSPPTCKPNSNRSPILIQTPASPNVKPHRKTHPVSKMPSCDIVLSQDVKVENDVEIIESSNTKARKVVKILPKSVKDKAAVSILKPVRQNICTSDVKTDISADMEVPLTITESDIDWLSNHIENEMKSNVSLSPDNVIEITAEMKGAQSPRKRKICVENPTDNQKVHKLDLSSTVDRQCDQQLSPTELSLSTPELFNDNFDPFSFLSVSNTHDSLNNSKHLSESGYGSDTNSVCSPQSCFGDTAESVWGEESLSELFPGLI